MIDTSTELWDPPPSRPSLAPAWIGASLSSAMILALVAAGGVVAHAWNDERYRETGDPCSRLDITAVATRLGDPALRPQPSRTPGACASIVLNADTYTYTYTYTSVLPAAQHKAAEATARLILTTARPMRGKIRRKHRHHGPTSTTPGPASTAPASKPAGQNPGKSHPGGDKSGAIGPSGNERPASGHIPHATARQHKTAGQKVGRRGFEPRT
ncbi:hypothetical protein QLQ12_45745 [Actinoplanes sp. NEAU-A12]|uniref:Uncharacterized protein n=1 Tax=Actinoplanes sandaracinus TaxID=3045177 RepID=A0ABT6X1L4_9ACTN|nr:hypothetical protein [Actinoplanes sandaracinus]MDI6105899.1 hypothetical protein [Actinoplanes sandaracinus]